MYVSESAVSFLGGAAMKAAYTWCVAPTWQDKLPTLSSDSAQAKEIAVEQQRNDRIVSWTFKIYEIWRHVVWWRGLLAPPSKSKKSRRSWILNVHAEILSETWTTLYQYSQRLFPREFKSSTTLWETQTAHNIYFVDGRPSHPLQVLTVLL